MAESKRICAVADCLNPSRKRGWCTKHYQRWQANGDPEKLVRKRSTCSVEGCASPVASGGLCGKHHMRMKKNGSTEKRHAANGELLRFIIETVLPYDGEACFYWPYNKSTTGYGQVRYEGRPETVSRLVCKLAHGEPGGDGRQVQAAHSCGKGHLGCVNPRHLRWASVSENASEKHQHGTMCRGSSHGEAILTEAQVREIRRLRGSMAQSKIAAQFGISQTHVCNLQTGKAWGWLK